MAPAPERILVVAPHPDDEALGAGGLMAKAHEAGHEVYVVLITSGDGFKEDAARYYLSLDVSSDEYLHMGYERQQETINALFEVGVPKDHIIFLGFPDGGLDALWLTDWNGEAFRSSTTGFNHVPYLTAWRPDVPYQGQNLLTLLIALYQEIQPTRFVMPSAFDTHPDHWGTNAFATLAWAEWTERHRMPPTQRWGYLVHWPAWPMPLAYRPNQMAQPPEKLVQLKQEPWHEELLVPSLVADKRRALMAYESQVELIKPFMLALCRKSEVFAVESAWHGSIDQGFLVVRNPSGDWLSKTTRRVNPLRQAAWGQRGDQDGVLIELLRPLARNEQLEVSLHPVGSGEGPRRFLIGAKSWTEGLTVHRRGLIYEVFWPNTWVGSASLVMAGVQLCAPEKTLGKVPFRIIKWGDAS